MNTVIYILCLLILAVLVCVCVLIITINKHNWLLKKYYKELRDIDQSVNALWPYIKFSSDANEMLLWKIRYNFANVKQKLTEEEDYENAQKLHNAIARTDAMITFYRNNLMNPGNEQNTKNAE